ncbi:MAG: hypothetical protein QOG15_876 [Solirubrobacteraceae bacterium]|jgi:hypothetical protein|nr:hypothetical protein [Solirubrobacteraceae bacterium]
MATSTAALLKRHRPLLKYDSQEAFFADSAAELTDCPGNVLRQTDGTIIATTAHGLSLATLGAQVDAGAAAATDVLSDPSGDYRRQARALHAQAVYANQIYGHAVRDSAGELWLQYWFFYFYNDYNLIGSIIKAGLHEGDWEMIQIHLDGDTPDRAVYAQHKEADARDWRQVDLAPGTQRPIVYVARGSHASYFDPGTHWTGVWFDYADGKRRSPDPALHVVVDTKPAWRWVRWPGYWGDTKKGGSPFDSDSPRGPAPHPQWDDPLALAGAAAKRAVAPPTPRPKAPPPPLVRPAWKRGRMRIAYELADKRATVLVVTINSPDEHAPPTYEAFAVRTPEGTVTMDVDVDPAHTYDIHASVATANAIASESVRAVLGPA